MTKSEFDLSIVTISFNQVSFLPAAYESILRATEEGIRVQWIVVDPGSTDGSREWVLAQAPTATCIFEPDMGPADGLNKGFRAATGQYIAYLNADDTFLEGSFLKVLQAFKARSDCDCIYGNGYIMDELGRVTKRVVSDPYSLWRYAYGNGVVLQQATFFRRDSVAEIVFNSSNSVSWDGEFLVDLARSGKRLCKVELDLACFRVYATSITGSQRHAAAYAVHQARLRALILGRAPKWYDAVIETALRAQKGVARLRLGRL